MGRLRILSTIALLKRLQRSEQAIARIQQNRLQALVRHAYNHVPYYREIFDAAGLRPEEINGTDDLQKLPVTTKEDIQKYYPARIVAEGTDLGACLLQKTTGSTGIPLEVRFGRSSFDHGTALIQFAFFEAGLRLRDRFVDLGHLPSEGNKGWFRRLGILPLDVVSFLQPMDSLIESLRKIGPDVIYGFPSVLLLLGREIEDRSIRDIRPRLILTRGETLTDCVRNEIARAFRSEVRMTYGSVEFMRLAFECKENRGLHMLTDSFVIEFLKGGERVREGEAGEIVVTGLFNYEMPLLRYRLGDVGVPSGKKCGCGRAFPLMESIEGRLDDFVILPSSTKLSPRAINWMEGIPGVAAYRIIQEQRDRLRVEIVKGRGFNDGTVMEAKDRTLKGCQGELVTVDVEIVEEIKRERTGKLRTILSMVRE